MIRGSLIIMVLAQGMPALPGLMRVRESAQIILQEITQGDIRLTRYRNAAIVAVVDVIEEDTRYDHGHSACIWPRIPRRHNESSPSWSDG